MLRARHGFTLLEASVALAVLGMVVIGAYAALGAALRADERARDALPAAALAQERLAQLVLASPRTLAMLPDSLARGRFPEPLARYAWAATSRRVPAESDLYDLTVTVTWAQGRYTLRSRRHRPALVMPAGTAAP